jgi:hypothetical protein
LRIAGVVVAVMVLLAVGVMLGSRRSGETATVPGPGKEPRPSSVTTTATTTAPPIASAPTTTQPASSTSRPTPGTAECPAAAAAFDPERPVMCLLDLWDQGRFDDMHPYAIGEVIADMRGLDPTGATSGLVGVRPTCGREYPTAVCDISNDFFELRFSVADNDRNTRVFRVEVLFDGSGI